jgi:heat shock protein HslJ
VAQLIRLLLAAMLAGVTVSHAAEPPKTPAAIPPTAKPVPAALAGIWQWVGFVSASGTMVVDHPDRYTLTFPDSAHIALQADCNRAAGGVAVGEDGKIKISPLAMTRAMCPEGSLSDRFAHDVGRATAWSKWDEELLLDMPANAGTLRFVRAP